MGRGANDPGQTTYGFGPGTFYSFSYGFYTVSSFQTYVSNNIDNPQSIIIFTRIHRAGFYRFCNIYLACIIVLVSGERTYHQLTNKEDRVAVMAAMLSFCIILLLNTINDMIETDKVGPFFLAMAIIVVYRNRARNQTLGKEYKAATGNDLNNFP